MTLDVTSPVVPPGHESRANPTYDSFGDLEFHIVDRKLISKKVFPFKFNQNDKWVFSLIKIICFNSLQSIWKYFQKSKLSFSSKMPGVKRGPKPSSGIHGPQSIGPGPDGSVRSFSTFFNVAKC